MKPTIQTVTGNIIDFTNPAGNEYPIVDIAWGLSNTCRFGGQCQHFYSVAQHSVLVSRLVDPQYAKEALMHDGTEAYLGDVPTPLKRLLPEYMVIEAAFDLQIRRLYGLPETMSPEVHHADGVALAIEKPQLTLNVNMSWSSLPTISIEQVRQHPIEKMMPIQAYELFMERYWELARQ